MLTYSIVLVAVYTDLSDASDVLALEIRFQQHGVVDRLQYLDFGSLAAVPADQSANEAKKHALTDSIEGQVSAWSGVSAEKYELFVRARLIVLPLQMRHQHCIARTRLFRRQRRHAEVEVDAQAVMRQ